MGEAKRYYLSVLFLEHAEGGWVAQCLEYDIAAQGKTLKRAMEAFERTVVGQVALDLSKQREPFQGIPQAPSEYWEEFDTAEQLRKRRSFRLPEGIPPGFIIAAQDQRLAA
jgi:hypothetical protein